ncbi:sugar ABC transporter substrate-binding protein [Knoellia sp. DB2414S]|uniref:Sugar ABC transporter substrate-binding protein n=1 Tax=Knoellia koreensis TaxID=2730921 RepID=A0A849HE63_9MICO|nr:sugar ABC transporter substrate-binding protein [Knoellia sp. DB2414S]
MSAAVVVAATALVAACSSGESRGPGSGEPAGGDPRARITFQLKAEPEEKAVYESLTAAYGKQGGGPVELVPLGRKDHLARLSTAFAAGTPPDVFLLNYREFSPFVLRGAIEPVGPVVEEAGVRLDDYYEEPRAAFTYDGALQCMPQNISSMVVYWNTELFAKAGVAPPTSDWTFDELVAAARALTRGGVKGLGIEPTITRMAPVIWGNGGRVVDDLESPTRLTLDEPAAREALQRMAGLAREVSPDKESQAAQGLLEQFMTGKLAMFMSSRVEVPALREQAGLSFDVAPMPGMKQPAAILHSDAYCIAKGSQNKAAAARFIAYAVGQQGSTITALGGRTVPSLTSVAESPAFLTTAKEPKSSQVFLDNIPNLQHTPVVPAWPEIEDVIETELTRTFLDGVPLDETLKAIRAQADPLLQQR